MLLVPDLDQNLLSEGQLVKNRYAVYFEDDACMIYDKRKGRNFIAKINMKSRSFQLTFNYGGDVALKAQVNDESWLWHRRLGHLYFHRLKLF